jgi:flagellin
MKLTDGVNVYHKNVMSSGQQPVLFDNGVSALLGSSFDVSKSMEPRIFDITSGSNMELVFQVAELSTDVLIVNLPSATLSALNLMNIDINTELAAQQTSSLIDQALSGVNKSYAQLGAQQKQLEINKDILASNLVNMQAALSEFIDADVPEAMTRMTSSSVQYQIASAMLVQANERTQQLLAMTR